MNKQLIDNQRDNGWDQPKLADGKIVIITGGTSSIGRATAAAFARQGAQAVVISARSDQGVDETLQEIEQTGTKGQYIRCDVTDEEQVRALVDETAATYGRVDAAFNSAGWGGPRGFLHEIEGDAFDALMTINVKGVFLCLKHQIRLMLSQPKGGAIVNAASMGGVIGFPHITPYIATKHAVIGLTKGAAIEYGQKQIRVNAIAPGIIDTPMTRDLANFTHPGQLDKALQEWGSMHPIGRVGQPDEVANTVVFLCSDQASFMIGHTLLVDGGYTIQ